MLQGITEVVKQQAEQRINSRFTMYVPGIDNLEFEENSSGLTLWKLCRFTKKLKKARDYLGSAQKHNCGTIVERYLEDEQYQVRTHARTKKDTRNPTWKNLTEEQIRKDLRDVFSRKGLLQRSLRRSYNPTNEEAATP